jgi:hypothetical protein
MAEPHAWLTRTRPVAFFCTLFGCASPDVAGQWDRPILPFISCYCCCRAVLSGGR